eukprot:gnl/Chilomastix_cuspidata/1419.p1 GENE.gnl/Chilomastix_cuspidata/1419~~gnl/Chilomastix_cuspidata/1419.p1  ORF type:complete len:1435 (+),score=592.96 gnl/Chilomastix_cuspidata/1419:219-4523(+)
MEPDSRAFAARLQDIVGQIEALRTLQTQETSAESQKLLREQTQKVEQIALGFFSDTYFPKPSVLPFLASGDAGPKVSAKSTRPITPARAYQAPELQSPIMRAASAEEPLSLRKIERMKDIFAAKPPRRPRRQIGRNLQGAIFTYSQATTTEPVPRRARLDPGYIPPPIDVEEIDTEGLLSLQARGKIHKFADLTPAFTQNPSDFIPPLRAVPSKYYTWREVAEQVRKAPADETETVPGSYFANVRRDLGAPERAELAPPQTPPRPTASIRRLARLPAATRRLIPGFQDAAADALLLGDASESDEPADGQPPPSPSPERRGVPKRRIGQAVFSNVSNMKSALPTLSRKAVASRTRIEADIRVSSSLGARDADRPSSQAEPTERQGTQEEAGARESFSARAVLHTPLQTPLTVVSGHSSAPQAASVVTLPSSPGQGARVRFARESSSPSVILGRGASGVADVLTRQRLPPIRSPADTGPKGVTTPLGARSLLDSLGGGKSYNALVERHSRFLVYFQRGEVINDTPEFKAFKRANADVMHLIRRALGEVASVLSDAMIDLAVLDGQAIATHVRCGLKTENLPRQLVANWILPAETRRLAAQQTTAEHLIPAAHDSQKLMPSIDLEESFDVIPALLAPGALFRSGSVSSRRRAAVFIQSVFRGARDRCAFRASLAQQQSCLLLNRVARGYLGRAAFQKRVAEEHAARREPLHALGSALKQTFMELNDSIFAFSQIQTQSFTVVRLLGVAPERARWQAWAPVGGAGIQQSFFPFVLSCLSNKTARVLLVANEEPPEHLLMGIYRDVSLALLGRCSPRDIKLISSRCLVFVPDAFNDMRRLEKSWGARTEHDEAIPELDVATALLMSPGTLERLRRALSGSRRAFLSASASLLMSSSTNLERVSLALGCPLLGQAEETFAYSCVDAMATLVERAALSVPAGNAAYQFKCFRHVFEAPDEEFGGEAALRLSGAASGTTNWAIANELAPSILSAPAFGAVAGAGAGLITAKQVRIYAESRGGEVAIPSRGPPDARLIAAGVSILPVWPAAGRLLSCDMDPLSLQRTASLDSSEVSLLPLDARAAEENRAQAPPTFLSAPPPPPPCVAVELPLQKDILGVGSVALFVSPNNSLERAPIRAALAAFEGEPLAPLAALDAAAASGVQVLASFDEVAAKGLPIGSLFRSVGVTAPLRSIPYAPAAVAAVLVAEALAGTFSGFLTVSLCAVHAQPAQPFLRVVDVTFGETEQLHAFEFCAAAGRFRHDAATGTLRRDTKPGARHATHPAPQRPLAGDSATDVSLLLEAAPQMSDVSFLFVPLAFHRKLGADEFALAQNAFAAAGLTFSRKAEGGFIVPRTIGACQAVSVAVFGEDQTKLAAKLLAFFRELVAALDSGQALSGRYPSEADFKRISIVELLRLQRRIERITNIRAIEAALTELVAAEEE